MTTKVIFFGKTEEEYLKIGIDKYIDRIKHYTRFEVECTSEEKILAKIVPNDVLILLDERGKEFSSVDFAKFIEKINVSSSAKNIYFIIGGPYGFSKEMYERANYQISLSKMTFSHQMVRLIFLEQYYRAWTILKGENYHHE